MSNVRPRFGTIWSLRPAIRDGSETDPRRIRPIAPGRHGAAGRKNVAEIAPCRWSKYRNKSPTVFGRDVKTLARPLVRILADGLAPLQAMGEKLQHGLDSKKRHICEVGQSALTEAKPRPPTEPTEAKPRPPPTEPTRPAGRPSVRPSVVHPTSVRPSVRPSSWLAGWLSVSWSLARALSL